MSITALSATSQSSTTWQTQKTGHGHGDRAAMRKALDAAAQTLGMSGSDLRSALQSGQSMSELAQSKGVDTDTLTTAISSAISGANSSLSSEQATEMAQRIVAGPPAGGTGRPDGPPPAGQGGRPPLGAAMDSLAGTLGISTDELKSSLQSGQSLTDVAAAHGMDADTLKTTLTTALAKADSALTPDRADSIADHIIAGPAQRRQQDGQFARLMFDQQSTGSGSGTTGWNSISQATLQALYSKYATGSTTAQLVSTL
ncbi:hypothetical protein ODJ79_37985 [Actinoplanes sp. KI2]|uniref:hypothetical protein n=1 Tax=Actinoplanes sp. KI2 TaxID=2983315 RepID=UPI0021D5E023|nr:hypothetical protein [Actinoplanes sp. KI2]MCU7729541.1 hypothetical protein [Actinoplanes sp. KI2]